MIQHKQYLAPNARVHGLGPLNEEDEGDIQVGERWESWL